jgi:hypothetical protein
MQSDLIREITEVIVRDQLLLNWRLYVVVGGLSFLASTCGNWVSSYLKKRGETLATKADMQEILRQVSATTRATEEVRSSISQADWVAREWRTTRRLKLEELLAAAYSLDQWLDMQRSRWVYGAAPVSDAAPMERLKLLATLYFPELRGEANAVWLAHQNALVFILESGQRTSASRNAMDVAGHQVALDQFAADWKPLYESARKAISALESRASALMTEVAGAARAAA